MTKFDPFYVVAEAREWLETPYKHHGRTKGQACDCVGLIVGVGEALGLDLYPKYDYSQHPTAEKLLSECDAVLTQVWTEDSDQPVQLVAGMVVAMRVRTGIRAQHLGVIGEHRGRLTIVHAFNKNGKVCEHTFTDFWRERVCRAYHYPNVDYGVPA